MNRPQKIRSIYEELKHSIGIEHSDKDLLLLASDIVSNYEKSTDKTPNFSLRLGYIPFEQQELPDVFADGGWKVMSYETELMTHFYADHRDEISDNMGITHWFREYAV